MHIFFDTKDIKGGDDWEHRILGGIRSARLLLACLSPNYLDSEYCAKELIEYLKHELSRVPLGEGIMPVYLSEIERESEAGDQRTSELVTELRRRQYFDFQLYCKRWAGGQSKLSQTLPTSIAGSALVLLVRQLGGRRGFPG